MHAVHRGRSSKQTSADDVDGHESAGRGSEAEDVAYPGERPKPVSSEATTGAAIGTAARRGTARLRGRRPRNESARWNAQDGHPMVSYLYASIFKGLFLIGGSFEY